MSETKGVLWVDYGETPITVTVLNFYIHGPFFVWEDQAKKLRAVLLSQIREYRFTPKDNGGGIRSV